MFARVFKVLRYIAIGFGVLVGVLLVGAELLLHTALARAWLRGQIQTLASSALDARVEVDRLESISLVHARVGGVRIFDPSGRIVAKAAELDVGVSPLWLIVGRLRLHTIVLDYGYVDLGAPLEDNGGGLLGLFATKPGEPESPPSSGGGLRIELPRVRLLHTRVDATLGGARYSARDVDTDAGLQVEPGFAIAIRQLHCGLLRDEQSIGGIDSSLADRARAGETNLRIAASVAGAHISLAAKLGAESKGIQTVSAEASVRDFSGETLARLGVDGDWLTAPIATTLHVTGKTNAFDYTVAVATPGGPIDAAGRFATPTTLSTTLRVTDLEPSKFLRARIAKLSALLRAQTVPSGDADTTKIVLAVDRGRYDGTDLPKVDAQGRWNSARGLEIEHFEAAYDAGSVSGNGRLAPDGALELLAHVQSQALAKLPPVRRFVPELSGALSGDLRFAQHSGGALEANAQLAMQKPAIGTTRASELHVKAELRGASFDRAQVNAQVLGSDVHVGDVDVPNADVRITGGPTRYAVNGRFGDKGHVDLTLTRERERLELDGDAHLVVDRRGNALDAAVRELRYASDAISVRSLQVSYCGARLAAAGHLDKGGGSRRRSWRHASSELTASVHAPDLREVTSLWLPSPIPGGLQAQIALSGDLDAPDVRVDARYRDGNVHGFLLKSLTLAAHADLPKRTIALDMHAEEVGGGSIQANVQSRLPKGTLSAAGLRDAEHEVALRFTRVELNTIDEWPRDRLMPTHAEVSGEVHAKGTFDAPALDTKLQTNMTFKDENALLAIALVGHYDPDSVALDIDAKDAQGPLLRTHVQTKLEHDVILRDMQGLGRFIAERSWQISVWLGARRIDQMPGVRALNVSQALWPAQVSAEGKLAHEPGQEPEGELHVQAVWDAPGRTTDTINCGLSRRPRLDLDATMKQGALHATVDASVEGRHMLAVQMHSDEPVDQWLRASAERAQPVSLFLQAKDLRLQDVPIVCEHATGFVSGSATLKRALLSAVAADVDLRARGVRIDQAPPFDAEIAARADRQILIGSAKLKAKDGSAVVAAHLPIDGGGRMPTLSFDQPATVDINLRNIDARALLAPVSAVRATRGQFEGDISMRGSLRSPTFQGALAMRDVSVTLAEAGQRFEHVTGKLSLDGRHLHLYPTHVHDRDGQAEISGDATLISMTSWQMQFEAKAKRFRVRRSGVVLALLDGTVGMKATVDPKGTELDVTLADGRVQLTDDSLASVQSLDEHPDVTFVDDGPQAKADRVQSNPMPVLLRFRSKNPFWIRRSDFSALVTTDLRIEVRGGKPALSGSVEIERGVVELLGQLFDIEQGKITFTGGYEIAPTLELTAKRNVPGGATVTIQASGPLYEPQLTFLLDGQPVTAGEALSVATGTSSGTGSDATVQGELSSMASGIAGSVLTLGARRELGDWVPVLAIERNQNQTRVRAGVEADRFIPHFLRKIVVDAYVEGIFAAESSDAASQSGSSSDSSQSSGQANQGLQAEAGVLLELRFPKHLVGEAQYGPGQQWSLDLNYQP